MAVQFYLGSGGGTVVFCFGSWYTHKKDAGVPAKPGENERKGDVCMDRPLISVVMAAYNVADRAVLDLAIESILGQDTGDWELLICDDASTNETYRWLQDWQGRDGRICVIRNETNRKAAAARNRCIAMARGEYIAIMDADDACSPDRLRLQAEFLDSNPQYDFVGLRGERFIQVPGDRDDPYWLCARPRPEDFRMTLPFVHASLMFRRQALLAVGGYEETARVERSEDYDLLLRMYAQGMRGANLAHGTYYFREDESAFRRRKYRYRLRECAVKWRGFRKLGLMPHAAPYALKPLIVGLLPAVLLVRWKGKYYGKHTETD